MQCIAAAVSYSHQWHNSIKFSDRSKPDWKFNIASVLATDVYSRYGPLTLQFVYFVYITRPRRLLSGVVCNPLMHGLLVIYTYR